MFLGKVECLLFEHGGLFSQRFFGACLPLHQIIGFRLEPLALFHSKLPEGYGFLL